jgi:hypothetical protein
VRDESGIFIGQLYDSEMWVLASMRNKVWERVVLILQDFLRAGEWFVTRHQVQS